MTTPGARTLLPTRDLSNDAVKAGNAPAAGAGDPERSGLSNRRAEARTFLLFY